MDLKPTAPDAVFDDNEPATADVMPLIPQSDFDRMYEGCEGDAWFDHIGSDAIEIPVPELAQRYPHLDHGDLSLATQSGDVRAVVMTGRTHDEAWRTFIDRDGNRHAVYLLDRVYGHDHPAFRRPDIQLSIGAGWRLEGQRHRRVPPVRFNDDGAEVRGMPDAPDLSGPCPASIARGMTQELWKPVEGTKAELQQYLTTPKVGRKDGTATSFATFARKRRRKDAVMTICAMAYDSDDGTPIDDLVGLVENSGYHGIITTTHSHMKTQTAIPTTQLCAFANNDDPGDDDVCRFLSCKRKLAPAIVASAKVVGNGHDDDGKPCVFVDHAPIHKARIIFLLDTPVDLTERSRNPTTYTLEYEEKYFGLAKALGLTTIDIATCDASRAFFDPRIKSEEAPFRSVIVNGLLLDYEDIPRVEKHAFRGAGEASTDPKALRFPSGESAYRWVGQYGKGVMLADIFDEHAEDYADPRGWVGDKLHIQCPFAEEHSSDTGGGTFVVNAEHGMEKYARIHCSHNACSTRDNLEFIVQAVETGMIPEEALTDPAYLDADFAEDDGDTGADGGNDNGAGTQAKQSDTTGRGETIEGAACAFEYADDDGKVLKKSPRNIRIAIAKMGVTLRFNEATGRYTIEGLDRFGPQLDDAAINRLHILSQDDFGLVVTKEMFRSVAEDLAQRRAFHPIRERLDALVWDGANRLDAWLVDYCGVEDTPVNRAFGGLPILAAAKRTFEPGAKFDQILVLIGSQGAGKSRAVRALALDDAWFTDNCNLSSSPKEIMELTQGKLIVEMGELDGLRKTDAERLKAMLSRQCDSARLAYGHYTTDTPRSFVVIGTTNATNFLKDGTGNRRFWPVEVGAVDVEGLQAVVEQIWAEAVHRMRSGASVQLDPSLYDAASAAQAHREAIADHPWTEHLGELLEGMQGRVKTADIWSAVGKQDASRRTQQDNAALGQVMRYLGFERKKLRFADGKHPQNGYERGDEPRTIEIHGDAETGFTASYPSAPKDAYRA